jgi:hypothetical protein
MRLIGYRTERAERPQLEKLWNIVNDEFPGRFHFAIQANETMSDAKEFAMARAFKDLREQGLVSFFRRNAVSASLDIQSYRVTRLVYPQSVFEIELMTLFTTDRSSLRWASLAEKITDECELDLAVVLGPSENTADYRGPLGIGIGLIKPFWIMVFGRKYSQVLQPPGEETFFFRRKMRGEEGFQSFIAAETYEDYKRQTTLRIESQKCEIGIELFHRRPMAQRKEEPAVSWILSPHNVVRFVSAVIANRRANDRKYQAKVVPSFYMK